MGILKGWGDVQKSSKELIKVYKWSTRRWQYIYDHSPFNSAHSPQSVPGTLRLPTPVARLRSSLGAGRGTPSNRIVAADWSHPAGRWGLRAPGGTDRNDRPGSTVTDGTRGKCKTIVLLINKSTESPIRHLIGELCMVCEVCCEDFFRKKNAM